MKNKYLCLTDKCFDDYKEYCKELDKLNAMIPNLSKREYEHRLYDLQDNFKVELDKKQLIKQFLVLNGMLIKFSEYLSNSEDFKEWENNMVKYSQDHLVPYINNEVLIEYVYKSLYYFRNVKFCDDLCRLKDKVVWAIKKEKINEK